MGSSSVTILYDDDCGFCRWSADRIRRLDGRGVLAFVPIQGEVGADLLEAVPPQLRLATMHAVTLDGRVWSGGEAARVILEELPGGVFLSHVAAAFPELTDRVYRFVAANREVFSGWLGQDRCSVDPSLAPRS
jgi:predicted DCC family thiol-disulfide oxidoreductase YuxK